MKVLHRSIAEVIKLNNTLINLCFSFNCITDDCAAAIVVAIQLKDSINFGLEKQSSSRRLRYFYRITEKINSK